MGYKICFKSWDLFGNLFQKYERLCCFLISKGKNKAPAVLKGILWHKTKRIQDIWKSWVLFDILFHLITMLWTSRVKPINCVFFCCRASTINRRLSCQRLYALLVCFALTITLHNIIFVLLFAYPLLPPLIVIIQLRDPTKYSNFAKIFVAFFTILGPMPPSRRRT